MTKPILTILVCGLALSSCSVLKQAGFTAQDAPVHTTVSPTSSRFIDEISVTAVVPHDARPEKSTLGTRGFSLEKEDPALPTVSPEMIPNPAAGSNVTALQLKYAPLLNTSASSLYNLSLLEGIDSWYGTRYRLGGTTKKGIDCSAFVGAIYASVFGISLPRTAREQFRVSKRVSRTELQEGDLVFFNTRGGVSHVGIYLQNNKFVHASVTRGVVISDLFESYYIRRFVGAGRIESKTGN